MLAWKKKYYTKKEELKIASKHGRIYISVA